MARSLSVHRSLVAGGAALAVAVLIGGFVVIQAARPSITPALAGRVRRLFGRQRVTPRQQVDTRIGDCHISIEYGGPFKRGREIWGSLVPWNRWWMPGADETTTLTTSLPIAIGDLAVPAGDHTLYTIPSDSHFQLVVNNELNTFHTYYNQRADLGRVPMTLRKLQEPVEEMTFTVEPRSEGGGTLALSWDDREYSVAFTIGAAASH
jgi:hypothetical protein